MPSYKRLDENGASKFAEEIFAKVKEVTDAIPGGGGGNSNIVDATFSEFEALTNAQKNNGTIYFVSATGGKDGIVIDQLPTITRYTSDTGYAFSSSGLVVLFVTKTGDATDVTSLCTLDIDDGDILTIPDGEYATSTDVTISYTENGATYTTTFTVYVVSSSIPTFADATEQEFMDIISAMDSGALLPEDTGWSVGDKRAFSDLPEPHSGSVVGRQGTDNRLVIVDSGKYELVTPTSSGRSIDHFVIARENTQGHNYDLVGKINIDSEHTSGSWDGCAARSDLNTIIKGIFPSYLRSCIKEIKVLGSVGNELVESNDYISVFAEKEILGTRIRSSPVEAAALTQIKYYETAANRIHYSSRAWEYWTRSPVYESVNDEFVQIGTDGNSTYAAKSYDNARNYAWFFCV